MNENDIIKMCQRLAKKYKDPQEYDDLVSEGVMRCLELKNKGESKKNLFYTHAAFAMNDYYNIKRHSVNVPVQAKAKSMSQEDEIKSWTDLAMHNVLYSETVELDESCSATPSVEIEYEKKEWLRYLKSKMVEVLDEEELKIIDMRYFSNMTQDDVANRLGKHQKWVSRKEIKALKKIRDNL
jgi:RNA polymerase sigma factor (sigma-70 family)